MGGDTGSYFKSEEEAMKTLTTEITPRITADVYCGYLPVARGHLDPGDGKTWLGVAVTAGHTRKGYGSIVVEKLCRYADNAGWDLWLTCPDSLLPWYGRFGFVYQHKTNVNYMRRVK